MNAPLDSCLLMAVAVSGGNLGGFSLYGFIENAVLLLCCLAVRLWGLGGPRCTALQNAVWPFVYGI